MDTGWPVQLLAPSTPQLKIWSIPGQFFCDPLSGCYYGGAVHVPIVFSIPGNLCPYYINVIDLCVDPLKAHGEYPIVNND